MSPSQNMLLTPCLLGADPKREPEKKPARSDDDPPTLPIPTREGREGAPREATLRGVAPTREEIDAYRAAREARAPQSTQDVSLSELELVNNVEEGDVTLCDATPPHDAVAGEASAEWLVTDRSFATTFGAGALALVVALAMVLGRPPAEATPAASAPAASTTANASAPAVDSHEPSATATAAPKPTATTMSTSARTPTKHALKASPRATTRTTLARPQPRLKSKPRAKLTARR